MAQNVYGPGVRMGNWNEDVYLEEVRRLLSSRIPRIPDPILLSCMFSLC